MAWKRYFTQSCPFCQSKSYRDGKTESGYQRYECTNAECHKKFDERDLEKETLALA